MAAVPLAEVVLDVRHIHILPILIHAADVKDKVSNARTEWLLASNLSYLRDPEERGREEGSTERREGRGREGGREGGRGGGTRKREGGREWQIKHCPDMIPRRLGLTRSLSLPLHPTLLSPSHGMFILSLTLAGFMKKAYKMETS